MSQLTLELANKIIQGALQEGAQLQCKPLTVVVLDAGGHLKAMQRQDSTSLLRPEIAFGKTYGALSLGSHSRAIQKMAEERPIFVNSLIGASQGKLVPAAGGILFCNKKKTLLGAIGVTGDTSDRDEQCAIAGVKNAGFLLFKS